MPHAAPSVGSVRRSTSQDLLTTLVSTSYRSFRHGSGSLSFLSLEVAWSPVRGAFPHQPHSYAKPSSQLECSVLLMTQLEVELQGQLQFSRVIDRRSDHTEIAISDDRIWSLELRMIEDVEGFGAKLEMHYLAESR